jgi:hypothetical protein
MRLRFTATESVRDIAFGTVVCGVKGDQRYLIFQRPVERTEDDAGPYLEYADQLHGAYHCIAACRLDRGALAVDLAHSLKALPDVKGFDIDLLVGDSQFAALRSGLGEVFDGYDGLLHVA